MGVFVADQYMATGRRKTAVARVILRPGEGKFVVNRRPIDAYFAAEALRVEVQQPLAAVEMGVTPVRSPGWPPRPNELLK